MLRQRVYQLAREYRQLHAPLTPERLVRGIGATYAFSQLPPEQDGAFDFERNRIWIAEGQNPKRQRFTLAHEVMHHLIRHDDEALSLLHENYEGEALEKELENMCNLGAAELLLPSEAVGGAIDQKGLRAKLIPDLAERHQVSDNVAAIALCGRSREPILTLIAGGHTLEVYFSFKNEGFPQGAYKGTPIPTNHPLAFTQQTAMPFRGPAVIPGHKRDFWLDAWSKGIKGGRVYGLYRLPQPS